MDADKPEAMQLPYLETFSKAAELMNFSKAGKALGMTQAAVSQRIQTLEKSLGKSLFRRHGGRVTLTDGGQKLYQYAQEIIELHQKARRDITGRDAPVTGELLIGASSIPGEHLLPTMLSAFHKKYPHIRVHASISDSMGTVAQVEHGEVNLGLVGRKTDNSHLEFRYLTSDKLVLVVPPDHALSKRKKVLLRQLLGIPLVLREEGSGLRHCLEKSLKEAGRLLTDFDVALELGSNEAVKKAVLQGTGAAVLSTFAVQKELEAKQLLPIEISDLRCDRDMFIVVNKRKVLPITARLFLTFLETHLASSYSA